MFVPVLSRSTLYRASAVLVLLTSLCGPVAALTRQPVAEPTCPLSAESLPEGVKHTLCRSDILLGETLLVRAEERLRLSFAQPREVTALKEATERWDQRLSQCGSNESCLSSLLLERRKGLEAELQDRAGRWPTAASWRLQGTACSQAGAPLPVAEAVALFSFADSVSVSGLFVRATECGRASAQGYWRGALRGNLALVHDYLPEDAGSAGLPATWLVARYGGGLLVEPVMGHSAFASATGARFSGAAVPERAGAGAGVSTRPPAHALDEAEERLAQRVEAKSLRMPRIRWSQ